MHQRRPHWTKARLKALARIPLSFVLHGIIIFLSLFPPPFVRGILSEFENFINTESLSGVQRQEILASEVRLPRPGVLPQPPRDQVRRGALLLGVVG